MMFIPEYEILEDLIRIRKTKQDKGISSIHNIWFVNSDDIIRLRKLNEFLAAFEFSLRDEIDSLLENTPSTNSLSFKEIEVNLHFYLNKNDSEYMDDEDNILLIAKDTVHISHKRTYGIADKNDHNVIVGRKGHAMENDIHCRLMHLLYDDTDLSWDEILRIGSIDYRLNIVSQSQEIDIY